jgi:hypothetical protein
MNDQELFEKQFNQLFAPATQAAVSLAPGATCSAVHLVLGGLPHVLLMFASRRTGHLIHDSRGLRTYRMARAEVLEWLVVRTISVPQTAVRAILELDVPRHLVA